MARNSYEMLDLTEEQQQQSHASKISSRNDETAPLSSRSSITVREPKLIRLRAHTWPIGVFVFYATLCLTSWIFLCILSNRFIPGKKNYYYDGWRPERDIKANERYIRAAQILQTIAALFTIPVTSAICSIASVAYMQAGRWRMSLTLRQTMALADQGWISPRMLNKLGKVGSIPLFIAFGMTLIGMASQIVQSALVGQEDIMASSSGLSGSGKTIMDVPDLLASNDNQEVLTNQLQGLLETSTKTEDEVNLWGHGATTLPLGYWFRYFVDSSSYPGVEPYFVALPNGFSTGSFPDPQYAPRMTSSLVYTDITENEFKTHCRNETDSGGLYMRYEHETNSSSDWATVACMPGDLRKSPWKSIHDRQDITETLYLRIFVKSNALAKPQYYQATARTSLGYFELPSESNNRTAGPLLDKYPWGGEHVSKRDETLQNVTYSGNRTLLEQPNKGPLTNLALALWGPTSFIASRMANPSGLILPSAQADEYRSTSKSACLALPPLSFLLESYELSCLRESDFLSEEGIVGQVGDLLSAFQDIDSMRGALSTGLFLSNKLWLGGKSAYDPYESSLQIYSDEGIRTFKPKLSRAGMVVGSVFLAIHLIGLLALAIFATLMRPWRGTMGSEIMVKMGIVYADVLERKEGWENFRKAAGKLPGYIGDERPNESEGRLKVGASRRLGMSGQRRYEWLR